MASGFSSTYNPRTRNSSLGLAPRVLFNNTPRPRYPLTDRSGVPLSRTRRRIVCGTMPPVSQTCRFFRAGLCQYGDRCRFFHIEVPHTVTSNDFAAANASANAGSSTDEQQQQPQTQTQIKEITGDKLKTVAPETQQTATTTITSTSTTSSSSSSSSTSSTSSIKTERQETNHSPDICQSSNSSAPSAQSQSESVETTTTTTITTDSETVKTNSVYDKWLEAPEFVPSVNKARMKSYAEAVNPSTANDEQQDKSDMKLCPYAEMHGVCSYSDGECTYLHGDICDLCGTASLHPFNQDKRKQHIQSCIEQHERNMELSFAVQRSKEKSCGVCFEIIMEKAAREQRFGILPNCNHCFCLTCIRKWRQAKQFDNKIIRACPECRVTSDFVCPSMYWVDTKEEKEKLIKDYKCALSLKNCKYFKQGRGKCPFGNKCFYLHALPDGTKTDVGPPPRQPRRQAHDGDIDVLQQIILWDFLDERENRWLYSIADDLEDLVAFFSDSEDSDWSDYEVFFD